MPELISIILATLVIVAGYALTYVQDRDKLRRYRYRLVMIGVLAVGAVWFNYWDDTREGAEAERRIFQWQRDVRDIKSQYDTIQIQNSLLLTERDSLRSVTDKLANTNREMLSVLQPLRAIANSKFPGLSEREVLRRLVDNVSGMQPKLELLPDKVQWGTDPKTGLVHTLYSFRSRYPLGLRDIRIKMRFNRTITSTDPRLMGALVEEQGTRIALDPDSLGFSYGTGYLREGNDILIEVISRENLIIDSMNLAP